MNAAQVRLPEVLIPVFTPQRGALAYRGAYGGRGSGKTRNFAKMTAIWIVMMRSMGLRGVVLCAREFQNSLADSSMEEIKSVILEDDWLSAQFDIGETYIRTKDKQISYLFVGLRHNLDSIKSKARVLLTWCDECENVSEVAWRKLIATVMREPGSEIWLTWNPESSESSTNKRFRLAAPSQSLIVPMNWSDNPWFPPGLERERLDDLAMRPEIYQHIWEGDYLTLTDAQIFAGKYSVREFEVDASFGAPYQGGDFGYSQDPSAAIRAYIKDGCLWVSHEAGGLKIELDDLPRRVMTGIPEFERYWARWDSAQPAMISHIINKGLPKSVASKKGKGSVEDGIMFIRSFKHVYIHPRCKMTAREFMLYSWKVDSRSGDILPDPIDKDNHQIDSLRYALEPVMRNQRGMNWAAV